VRSLLEAFERVSTGSAETILVSGYKSRVDIANLTKIGNHRAERHMPSLMEYGIVEYYRLLEKA
jgi:predicted ArsR family transcriptional regulator